MNNMRRKTIPDPPWMIREKLKQKCIEYKGGSCTECGLADTCSALYDFHHREETVNSTPIGKLLSGRGTTINKALRTELDKCDLLCSNCHRRLHDKHKTNCRATGKPIWKQKNRKGRPINAERRSVIAEQRLFGTPVVEIADKLGISRQAVYAMIARMKS